MGLFIAIEGIDGAGKTTQVEQLALRLEAAGYAPPLVVHEPGGTALGERLRTVLKDATLTAVDPVAELLLFAAARAQLVREALRPHLEAGGIALSDRYTASTLAYQGYGRGLDTQLILAVEAIATGGLRPDAVLLLDIPVAAALGRKARQGGLDRFESERVDFYRRVRDGYLALAESSPEHWTVIDASAPKDAVAGEVWRAVAPLLDKAGSEVTKRAESR